MKAMKAQDNFLQQGKGGTELAPMSTTRSLKVAMQYSASENSCERYVDACTSVRLRGPMPFLPTPLRLPFPMVCRPRLSPDRVNNPPHTECGAEPRTVPMDARGSPASDASMTRLNDNPITKAFLFVISSPSIIVGERASGTSCAIEL
jgi:hypothetical protein